ncbi:hypothetical protein ACFYUR_12360 [Micromonospora haikouensis]|uniref:hypothetical protein n=1 Tax=Micromonospora haikouensis TaxID=686309 RepID=UPI0036CE39F2
MTALVLRIAPIAGGGQARVVPIGPGDLPEAERLCARVALLPSVREGRRVVEIVPAAGGDR